MIPPYFSVILPVYNVETYLARCMESILRQDFTDYEIILVDDGSTDSSGVQCDRYLEKYSFVKVVHKANGGLASARNAGLEKAEGQYILWIDTDDWIAGNTLSLIYETINGGRVDIIKYNYYREAEKAVPFFSNAEPGSYQGKEISRLMELALFSESDYGLSAWMHAYRRQFLKSNQLLFQAEKEVGSEDFLFNIEALENAEYVKVLKEPLYHYYLRPGSITQMYRKGLPERYTKMFLMLRAFFDKKGSLEFNQCGLCHFYVWVLMYGTCLVNEYRTPMKENELRERRRRVKAYFAFPEFQWAAKRCDRARLSWKERILLLAMRWRMEGLFYWLFFKKPKLKAKLGK